MNISDTSITEFDLHYRCGKYDYNNFWVFTNHPEKLRLYDVRAKTKQYWPGRSDNLKSESLTRKTFFKSDFSKITGTKLEIISELLEKHLIKGQEKAVVDYVGELMWDMDQQEWLVAYDLLDTKTEKYSELDFHITAIFNRRQRLIDTGRV